MKRLLNIIHLSQGYEDPGLVLFLHAKKAFDQVEWSYLFYTLGESGQGNNIVNWVRVLYNTPIPTVLTNGLRSSNSPIIMGID